MELIVFILLIALVIKEYRFDNAAKTAKKTIQNNAYLIVFWMTLFYRLFTESRKKEEDFFKLLKETYEHDYSHLGSGECKKRWEAVCESTGVQPTYNREDKDLLDLHEETLRIIAAKLYSNHALFPRINKDNINKFFDTIFTGNNNL